MTMDIGHHKLCEGWTLTMWISLCITWRQLVKPRMEAGRILRYPVEREMCPWAISILFW
jgi:hypothetical protein